MPRVSAANALSGLSRAEKQGGPYKRLGLSVLICDLSDACLDISGERPHLILENLPKTRLIDEVKDKKLIATRFSTVFLRGARLKV